MEWGENRDRTGIRQFCCTLCQTVREGSKKSQPRSNSWPLYPWEDMWLEVFVAIPRFRGLKIGEKELRGRRSHFRRKTHKNAHKTEQEEEKRDFPFFFFLSMDLSPQSPGEGGGRRKESPPPPSQCVFRTLSQSYTTVLRTPRGVKYMYPIIGIGILGVSRSQPAKEKFPNFTRKR